jgi:hypothetical protein
MDGCYLEEENGAGVKSSFDHRPVFFCHAARTGAAEPGAGAKTRLMRKALKTEFTTSPLPRYHPPDPFNAYSWK